MIRNSPIVTDRASLAVIIRTTLSRSTVNQRPANPGSVFPAFAILAALSTLSLWFYRQYHRYCHRHQGMTQDSRAG